MASEEAPSHLVGLRTVFDEVAEVVEVHHVEKVAVADHLDQDHRLVVVDRRQIVAFLVVTEVVAEEAVVVDVDAVDAVVVDAKDADGTDVDVGEDAVVAAAEGHNYSYTDAEAEAEDETIVIGNLTWV